MWEVEVTDEFRDWYFSLPDDQKNAVEGRISLLESEGPNLGRPTVDTIKTSRHQNMKELRCSKSGVLRVLFVFDPLRQAVLLLLLGGDKAEASQWSAWYQTAIPKADDLYDDYLEDLRKEGLIP